MQRDELRFRQVGEADREAVTEVYRLSQQANGLPNPQTNPPDTLGERLLKRQAIRRYVAEHTGKIVGHGLVELPNPEHIPMWLDGTHHLPEQLLELGGAFVHPDYSRAGIWTGLLEHRLDYVSQAGSVAVAATWIQNTHVMRVFERHGAVRVGEKYVEGGELSLYRFAD